MFCWLLQQHRNNMQAKLAGNAIWQVMHGVAVDSYCEQYSHKYRKQFLIQRFSLVVSHHQEQKNDWNEIYITGILRCFFGSDELRVINRNVVMMHFLLSIFLIFSLK